MIKMRSYQNENDFWRVRNFLREIFLLNDRLEYSWHVARLDYWRWHYLKTCQSCGPIEEVTSLWETDEGKLIAVAHPISYDEIRLHIHPVYRSPELENEMLAISEEVHLTQNSLGEKALYLPILSDDIMRQEVAIKRNYQKIPGWGHHWRRDLETDLPERKPTSGYQIRSMGGIDEHPTRSLASWRSFHNDEPEENYDQDWSWFQNLQMAPLYRRDLDIVAATPQGDIAAFCTMYYDDYTRSAVCVLVGTAAGHWQRGLGKAVMSEGFHRLHSMGCTRVFATAHDLPADKLYGSMMRQMMLTETWVKQF